MDKYEVELDGSTYHIRKNGKRWVTIEYKRDVEDFLTNMIFSTELGPPIDIIDDVLNSNLKVEFDFTTRRALLVESKTK